MSFVVCLTAAFFWWRGEMIGDGVQGPFIGKSFYDIDSRVGRVAITYTQFDKTPLIVGRTWEYPFGSYRDYAPPTRARFSYRLTGEYGRVFASFKYDRMPWYDGYSYASIETPYWFLVALFAVLPIQRVWRIWPIKSVQPTADRCAASGG
jgi:hypothetical protein